MKTIRRVCLRLTFSFVLFLLLWSVTLAQIYTVPLPQLAPIDDWSVIILSSASEKSLILPRIDTSSPRFFGVFYGGDSSGDHTISAMVTSSEAGETIYFDKNGNENLKDDDPPLFFPWNVDRVTLCFASPCDSQQTVETRLQRRPDLPDSLLANYVDEVGNLNPRFTRMLQTMMNKPEFDGVRGSFYFETSMAVRRGTLSHNGENMDIGILDYGRNGLFDDEDDNLLVDSNHDALLSYPDEAFALNDIIAVNNLHLHACSVDRYGRWIDFCSTNEDPSFSFRRRIEEQSSGEEMSGEIADSIWNSVFTTIDGDSVSLERNGEEFLLLNFWGEWCKPCLAEIPALVEAQRDLSSQGLHILSFLRSSDLRSARKIIRDQGMTWQQIVLTDDVEKQFGISSYPTNILVLPGGVTFIRVGMIPRRFLERHLR